MRPRSSTQACVRRRPAAGSHVVSSDSPHRRGDQRVERLQAHGRRAVLADERARRGPSPWPVGSLQVAASRAASKYSGPSLPAGEDLGSTPARAPAAAAAKLLAAQLAAIGSLAVSVARHLAATAGSACSPVDKQLRPAPRAAWIRRCRAEQPLDRRAAAVAATRGDCGGSVRVASASEIVGRALPAADAGSARRCAGSACRRRSAPAARRPAAAAPASTPSILRAAMATCSRTSGDGSSASATTVVAHAPASTLPTLPAARTPQARKPASACVKQLPVETRRRERAACRPAPTGRASGPCAAPRASSTSRSSFGRVCRVVALAQQPLGDVAEVDVRAVQPLDQLRRRSPAPDRTAGARRVLVAHAIQPALQPVDARRVAVGVLVAVVAVVPVEDVQAAVGAGLLHDRHEPGVVGRQEVGLAAWPK